jgi:hypothetical protein
MNRAICPWSFLRSFIDFVSTSTDLKMLLESPDTSYSSSASPYMPSLSQDNSLVGLSKDNLLIREDLNVSSIF